MTQPVDRRRSPQRAITVVISAATVLAASSLFAAPAAAQQLMSYAATPPMQLQQGPLRLQQGMALPDDDQLANDDATATPLISERLRRTEVSLETREAPGTVIIDTAGTHLYYVLGHNRAIRYGVGVGREGFTWSGSETITRKAEWPDWHPPAAMIARQPYLPRFMAGGPGNPLGARALYLGASQYRIHGTNDPSTIGKFVSSGCIRLINADVEDLFRRVQIGAKVVVLPKSASRRFEAQVTEASSRMRARGDVAALR